MQDRDQALDVDRLHEVPLEARGLGARAITRLAVAGDRDQARAGLAEARLEVRGELVAVHDRQADVDERGLRQERLGDAQRGGAVVRDLDGVTVRAPRPRASSGTS